MDLRHLVQRRPQEREAARSGLLAELTPPARTAVRLLWAVGLGGLTVFTVAAGFGLDTQTAGFEVFYVCLYLVPAALCIARASLVRGERVVWALVGIGMASWGMGYAHYFVVLQDLAAPPYPSLSDALWLTYYGSVFVALLLLMRARLRNVRRSIWVDAVVGGLALAALSGTILVQPILVSTGGSTGAVVTNLAYPLADLLILSLLLGVFALTGWRPGRSWVVLGAVVAWYAVFDVVYLYQTATGTYETGSLLDVTFPAAMLLFALVAWRRPEVTVGSQLQGWPALAITSAFALIGLTIATLAQWTPVSDVVIVIATLTLVAAFVRTAMTFADMRSMAEARQLRVQEQLLAQNQSILNSAGEGICGLDLEGRTTFANPAAARLTGHAIEELIGQDSHDQVHHTRADGTDFPKEECAILKSLADGTVHECDDEIYWRKDGTSFPVEYSSTPMVEDGRVTGAVVVFKDISERRELERTKDEFTSVVSHELRTPLTSIRGSLGLLESGVLGSLPEKGQRMVEIAVENTDRLVRLINDILDIERIDSGQIDMRREPCEAVELIGRAVEGLQPLASEAQVTLVPEAEPATLLADPDRVLQTLTNLISNAVKFSPAGSTVRVASRHRDGEVQFQIVDEGRGIPADKLGSIFERFQQVDASDSREKGGTGLGLAICRTIVEHHGGRIWVESTPDKGTTFSFELPASAHHDRARGDEPSSGPVVLVCDDDPSTVEVVRTILEQRGYRVIEVHSGEQALERAKAEHPDAILLDLLMPNMSGWKTAAALSANPETSKIPIIVLSVLSEGEGEAMSEPAFDWLEKPLDEPALFDALERAVHVRSQPLRVLVVEDDPDLAGVLTAMLDSHGIETFEASDGRQAIKLSQQVKPDLLVLDVGLPEADGFEVVSWLREHECLRALPMVVYSGRDLSEPDRESLRLGDTTEFLTKGRIAPEDVERRVVALLGQLARQQARETSDEPEAHPVG